MEQICRCLDALKGNTLDVSPYNTRAQNSAIIARKNNEKFVNRKIRARTREIANIPKGIVNKIKSTTNFNLPDTPPQMPEEDYWHQLSCYQSLRYLEWLHFLQPLLFLIMKKIFLLY